MTSEFDQHKACKTAKSILHKSIYLRKKIGRNEDIVQIRAKTKMKHLKSQIADFSNQIKCSPD